MSDENETPSVEGSKPKPTTQQEFNLAAMDAIRHVAQYALEIGKLAGIGAGVAVANARANNDEAGAERIIAQGEEMRKAGLRYHNAALDMWEAMQKDAGPDLVKPRELVRVKVDD